MIAKLSCLTTQTYYDSKGNSHLICNCIKLRVAEMEAENAKLRAVARAARRVADCDKVKDELNIGWAWVDLREALANLETSVFYQVPENEATK